MATRSSLSPVSLPAAPQGVFSLKLICPHCGDPIGTLADVMREQNPCPGCGHRVTVRSNIVRALRPRRREFYEPFLRDYTTVRRAEGRGSKDSAFYLALPYRDLSGRHAAQWAIRGKSYRYFEKKILSQLEQDRPSGMDVLDLGAGNGWMSYRLTRRGHRVAAVDIFTDEQDGLAAAHHFSHGLQGDFAKLEAEFDCLPFEDHQFDLAVFNSSLHYSADYQRTLGEALRCLRSSGHLVILDSPIYQREAHGEQMRRERQEHYQARYGFRSDRLPSIEFLHGAGLQQLSKRLGLTWQIHRPWYGWRWHLRPWKARVRGSRPPSRFWIVVGTRDRGR